MVEWIHQTEGIWTYIVLFLLSAAPWLEVFLVIPLGVGMGLDPVAVAVTGFIGNWIPILLIGIFFRQLSAWLAKRKERKRLKRRIVIRETYSVSDGASERKFGLRQEQEHEHEHEQQKLELGREKRRQMLEQELEQELEKDKEEEDKKQRRARGIWVKYGLPGLALLAPAIVGTDIAAILALAFGSPRKLVMIWMTISLLLWTLVLTVSAVYGFSFVGLHS